MSRFARIIDRVVEIFSPESAARRAYFRSVLPAVSERASGSVSYYREAHRNRMSSSWPRAESETPGVRALSARTIRELRNRANHLERNNVLAAATLDRACENVVGTGISIEPTTSDEVFNQAAKVAWKREQDQLDARRRHIFSDLQWFTYRAKLRDGDLGVYFDETGPSLKIKLFGADFIETPPELSGKTNVREGLELDGDNAAVAYYVKGIDSQFRVQYFRIEEQAFQLLSRDPNENSVRGETAFAGSFELYDQVWGYLENTVVAGRVAAAQAMVAIKKNPAAARDALRMTTSGDGSSVRSMKIEPGTIHFLGEGEELRGFNPTQPTQSFPDSVATFVRFLGLKFGLTLEQLLLDFSRTNYSSSRAARLQAEATAEKEQQSFAINFVSQSYVRWLAIRRHTLGVRVPADWDRHEWIPQGRPWVDPTKEIDAAVKEVKELGVNARRYIARARGWDFTDVCKQNAADRKLMQENGLPTGDDQPSTQRVQIGTDDNGDPIYANVPGQPKASGASAEGMAGQALNGAQITAALDIMDRLRKQSLAPEAAAVFLVRLGIDKATADEVARTVESLPKNLGDIEFKREMAKLFAAMPQAREVLYNKTDIDDLVSTIGLKPDPNYKPPYVAVVAPTGPLNSGAVILDPNGDIVGADIENDLEEGSPANGGGKRNMEPDPPKQETP